MSKTPEENLSRRVGAGLAVHLDRAPGGLERITDYGTHLLVRCDQAGRNRPLSAPLLIGRQVTELADAVSVLVRRACVEPAKLLLRTQIEAVISLAYIAEKDTERRSIQYE